MPRQEETPNQNHEKKRKIVQMKPKARVEYLLKLNKKRIFVLMINLEPVSYISTEFDDFWLAK